MNKIVKIISYWNKKSRNFTTNVMVLRVLGVKYNERAKGIMNQCNIEASEQIRSMLNNVIEKNPDGTFRRLGWQILTYVVGVTFESSRDVKVRNLGCALSIGAKNSFADYVVQKASEWILKKFAD